MKLKLNLNMSKIPTFSHFFLLAASHKIFFHKKFHSTKNFFSKIIVDFGDDEIYIWSFKNTFMWMILFIKFHQCLNFPLYFRCGWSMQLHLGGVWVWHATNYDDEIVKPLMHNFMKKKVYNIQLFCGSFGFFCRLFVLNSHFFLSLSSTQRSEYNEMKERSSWIELENEEKKKTCFCSHRHHHRSVVFASLLNMSGLNHNRGNQIISFQFFFFGCSFLLLFHSYSCVFISGLRRED